MIFIDKCEMCIDKNWQEYLFPENKSWCFISSQTKGMDDYWNWLIENDDYSQEYLRWNLKNLCRGLNPPKPGLNLAPA